MSLAMYFRHKQFGHVVRADAEQPPGRDVFAGMVVTSDVYEAIAVGTYSTVWMRDAFERTTQTIDTFESMQAELDELRVALGVDALPLDTLPQRTIAAAQSYRRLYEKVKEWEREAQL